MDDTEEEIRQFLIDTIGWPGTRDSLTADYPLLDSGVLDSISLTRVASFVRDRYVDFEDVDFTPENFGSISAIKEFITSRKSES